MDSTSPNQDAVLAVRQQLWANGFRPVAVTSPVCIRPLNAGIDNAGKAAIKKDWVEYARKDPPEDVNAKVQSNMLNTGILCDDLVCIDIDVDETAIVSQIEAATLHFFGPAPKRMRNNSARCLLLYRAADKGHDTYTLEGSGKQKIEIRGLNVQCVAIGTHPSGVAYEWPNGGPLEFHRDTLTPVAEDAVFAFLTACAPLIGAESPKQRTTAQAAHSVTVDLSLVKDCHRNWTVGALRGKLEDWRLRTESSTNRSYDLNKDLHDMGGYVSNGTIDGHYVLESFYAVLIENGYVKEHGESATRATLLGGLNSGMLKPHELKGTDSESTNDSMLNIVRQSVSMWIDDYKRTHSKPTSQSSGKRTITLLQCSSIQAKPITWLWNGYLPQGKLTLLAGAGGTGKSTLAFHFAGTVSNGGVWPDGSRCNVPGNVLIWSSEDDSADTILPRLMAVRANLTRCGIISGAVDEDGLRCPFDAASDMNRLREAVQSIGGISLLIIDPIVTAVTGDMHKANDVRRSLQAIVDFASEMNCAVLGITHFAKGTAGKNSAERVIGSQAFAALARMVLVAAKEEDSQSRVFTRAKSNNSIDTGGFAYTIEAITLHGGIVATRVVWGEPLEGSSRAILSEVEGDSTDEGSSKLNQAKAFLLDTLKNGGAPSKELFEHAREIQGITPDTMRRAGKALSIIPRKLSMNGGWMWELPITINAR